MAQCSEKQRQRGQAEPRSLSLLLTFLTLSASSPFFLALALRSGATMAAAAPHTQSLPHTPSLRRRALAGAAMAALLIACLAARPALPSSASAAAALSAEKAAGWAGAPEEHRGLEGACSIPRVSVAEWERRRVTGVLEPVVIETGLQRNLRFRRATQRAELLRRFGHTDIVLSSANTFSYAKKTVSLDHYLEHMMAPRTLDDVGSAWGRVGAASGRRGHGAG